MTNNIPDTIISRGSTPVLRFNLDTSTNDIAAASISLRNGDTEKEWTLSDCTVGNTYLSIHLSQEDTLALSSRERCYIQLRIKFSTTDVSVSRVFFVKVMPWIGEEEEL